MDEQITLTKSEIANAFTEWMKRYEENPEQFLAEYPNHDEYGPGAAEYFCQLIEELRIKP